MKKLFVFFFFVSVSLLAAQEKLKNSETFEIEFFESSRPVIAESTAPVRLIIHRNDFWGLGEYKFSDGTNLSFSELNKALKKEADAMYVKRTNVFQTLAYALLAGSLVSAFTGIYADGINNDGLAENASLIGITCLCFGAISGVFAQSYREVAIDSYNLKMLGLTEN